MPSHCTGCRLSGVVQRGLTRTAASERSGARALLLPTPGPRAPPPPPARLVAGDRTPLCAQLNALWTVRIRREGSTSSSPPVVIRRPPFLPVAGRPVLAGSASYARALRQCCIAAAADSRGISRPSVRAVTQLKRELDISSLTPLCQGKKSTAVESGLVADSLSRVFISAAEASEEPRRRLPGVRTLTRAWLRPS